MLFLELSRASEEVRATRSRLSKVSRLAAVFAQLSAEEVEPAVALLAGEPRQGRVGVGGALLRRLLQTAPATTPTVSVLEVDAVLARFAEIQGPGSVAGREALLGALFARLIQAEREFLAGAAAGGLRQGALESIVLDAVASAAQLPSANLRRALLFAGSIGVVARAALVGGAPELDRFSLELFRPLRPMLADSAGSVKDALTQIQPAALEYKLDGARVQVHRRASDVAVFSREGNDVTARVPELVDAVGALPGGDLVLDGEAIAFDPSGRPAPFQTTMQRFGRVKGVEALRRSLPLSQVYFDCLFLDGELLLERPNAERFAALAARLPSDLLVPRRVVNSEEDGEAFVAAALEAGHEGVVAKSLDAAYDAGRRGANWLKLKPVHTLDLVVLAAEWGSGRRQGWLSNLHLGARDTEGGGFAMLGKTFKGMTDALLAWQTETFQGIATERDGHVVHLRPELVVEIAFDGIQQSQQYPGGFSLRFARVRRYRPDKRAEDASTLAEVRQLFERSRGQAAREPA